jgi:hypothetical protein
MASGGDEHLASVSTAGRAMAGQSGSPWVAQ